MGFTAWHYWTYFRAPNSGELANAINQLLNDKTLRLRYGRAAQMRAFSKFGLEAMLSRTMELYGNTSKQKDMKLAKRLSSQGALENPRFASEFKTSICLASGPQTYCFEL